MKRFLALLLAAMMLLSLAACSGSNEEAEEAPAEEEIAEETPAEEAPAEEAPAEEAAPAEKTDIKIAALKGPTAFGMLQLMDLADKDEAPDNYEFTLIGAPDEVVGKIIKGEFDIAAVPSNLASILYNKTEGNIQLLALNTLGVMYCVENGDSVQSVADLAGKTIYNLGKGATPQYILDYVLSNNGIDPEKDVTVEYKAEPAEVAALMAEDQAGIAILPQPFVTALMAKNPNIRIALDFSEEWSRIQEGTAMTMGCVVIQKKFAEENPEAVARFMEAYEASVNYTNAEETMPEAAKLAEKYEIMPAPIVEKAIPHCNIVFMEGDEMKTIYEPFAQILFDANPASVGGTMPAADFYYNAK